MSLVFAEIGHNSTAVGVFIFCCNILVPFGFCGEGFAVCMNLVENKNVQ